MSVEPVAAWDGIDDDPSQPDDQAMLAKMQDAEEYTIVLLHEGPRYHDDGSDKVVWEHGRRNFRLRDAGLLRIVCPVRDDSPLCGIGIFVGSPEQVRAGIEADPGVRAGVFRYEVHPCRSFPGDRLGGAES